MSNTKKSEEFILTPSKATIIPTSDSSQTASTSSSYSSLNVSLPISGSLKEENIVFGNDILETSPKKMGNAYTFFYYKAQPLITIGPDCKNSLNK